MTELTIIEQAVLDLIPLSIERKIAIREISSLIDIDERSVYEVINSLRKKGIPICAIRHGEPTNRGYFIATSEEERAEGLASYKAQVVDMSRLIKIIEETDLNGWQNRIGG
ncbi:MAG TPA: hypothetical protein PLN65_01665 [Enterococcus sp.]|nr:hypothetical protein [Enterococcus sp.]